MNEEQFTLFDDLSGSNDPEKGRSDPGSPLPQPGQKAPLAGHYAPQAGEVDRPYAFDWSVSRGIAAVDPAGHKLGPRTLTDLLLSLPHGCTLVGESTFESYDLRQRQLVMDLAESREITLLTVPARGNTRRRAAAGIGEKTSQSRETDYEDARAIQYSAVNGAHLKKPRLVEDSWAELREQAAKRFVYLRYSGQKEAYATEKMRRLPTYWIQPIERRVALGPTENYNAVIVAAVAVAAEFVTSRKDFERLAGFYAHGYPSQFRSDLIYWGWGRQAKKQERITLSVYRRELRWLFHQILSSGRCNPETGSCDPDDGRGAGQ